MGVALLAEAYESGWAMMAPLRPAAIAFDAIAPGFDSRFGEWASVAAQRRAVRRALIRTFPPAGRILELGGGTGEDAVFLAQHGLHVHLTDASPSMVQLAKVKLAPYGASAEIVAGEDLEAFAVEHISSGDVLFDGAFSNFAPLNCIVDLGPVARGLAQLLKPGATAMLVFFGTSCPGEICVELLRGRPQNAKRRFKRNEVPAKLAKREFHVVYHRRKAIASAFAPWFVLERTVGVGVAVPPSAAEPWISRHPHVIAGMEALDRLLARPLAMLGDHVLYQFRRTTA